MRIVGQVDQIKSILREFSDSLHSLRFGRIDIDAFSEKIQKNGWLCVCAEEDEIKGFAVFYANNHQTREAFLSMIAVKQKYRKDGIGSRLLMFVEKKSYQAGMRFLRLEVKKENSGAIIFYEKKGFSTCGSTEESLFMRKEIKEMEK